MFDSIRQHPSIASSDDGQPLKDMDLEPWSRRERNKSSQGSHLCQIDCCCFVVVVVGYRFAVRSGNLSQMKGACGAGTRFSTLLKTCFFSKQFLDMYVST